MGRGFRVKIKKETIRAKRRSGIKAGKIIPDKTKYFRKTKHKKQRGVE